jgi:hypothetical protein
VTSTLFDNPVPGTCLYCGGESDPVVLPSGTLAKDLRLGVCDVCSYGLAHFWKTSRGERSVAQSPRAVKTYLLVPMLPKGRAPEDISAYKFLVAEDGGLPWLHYVRDLQAQVSFLDREHGIATWAETTRSCYLGYDAHSDFCEVRLAWAWGRTMEDENARAKIIGFKSFEELYLSAFTPDAGFYLAVKQAFEALLAQRELSPERVRVCVRLREPAMRYITYQNYDSGLAPGVGHEDEDEAMVELCHAAMTSEELAVLALLEDGARQAGELSPSSASDAPEVRSKKVSEPATEDEVEDEGDDSAASGDSSEVVREGFARPARS